jgi:hypothetical protein
MAERGIAWKWTARVAGFKAYDNFPGEGVVLIELLADGARMGQIELIGEETDTFLAKLGIELDWRAQLHEAVVGAGGVKK